MKRFIKANEDKKEGQLEKQVKIKRIRNCFLALDGGELAVVSVSCLNDDWRLLDILEELRAYVMINLGNNISERDMKIKNTENI